MKTLIFSLVFGIFLAFPATRAGAQVQSGDYLIEEMTIEGVPQVSILAYLGTATYVVVPPYINGAAVKYIAFNAFQQTDVRTVSLPATLLGIGDAAFFECQNLETITIPDSVTEIGNQAFWNCMKLSSVTLGSKVEFIGEEAFEYCESLGGIVIPNSVEFLGASVFSGCISLRTASIGNKVLEIGLWAFDGCTALETLTIGSMVDSIGRQAFADCSALKSLVIPASLDFIDTEAFSNCSELHSLKFLGDAPALGDDDILYGANKSTVYYLDGSSGWEATFAGRPTAKWSGSANVPPAFTKRVPAANPAPANEGTTLTFSATADDSSDPEVAERGMASITWYLNETIVLETTTGAPRAITSTYKFQTNTATVQGSASGEFAVTAVALDKQGGTTETTWTVQINNKVASQTIAFKAIPPKAFGDADFAPGATASSGLPVEYSSSHPEVADIVEGVVRIFGAGTTVFTATQPGNFDFKAALPVKQTLVVKSRLIVEVPEGGGTVAGSGLYALGSKVNLTAKPLPNFTFLHWENGSQSPARTIVLGTSVSTVSATFKRTVDIPPATIQDPGAQICLVGIPFHLPLDINSESLANITLTGLPAGFKFDPVTRTISGVGTVSGPKKAVKVTVKNAKNQTSVLEFDLTINALPIWARGNFGGWFENELFGVGTAAMTVSAKGSTTGKLVFEGKTYSFLAPAFSSFDEDLGVFLLTVVAKSGKESLPLEIAINHSVDNPDLPAGFGKAEVTLGSDPDLPSAWLFRDLWKDADMQDAVSVYAAYYTATLSADSECGSGFMTFTADKTGMLKSAGKLADGTPFTSSLPFVMDESGRILAVLHTAPTSYKGGCFFGIAEFAKNDEQSPVFIQTADAEFLWENRNPLASADYDAGGFQRNLMIEGGQYDPAVDFRTVFPDGLECGGELSLPSILLPLRISDFDPDSMAENPPKISWTEYGPVEASGMSPEGLQISVVPATGIGTGLSGPKVGVPVKVTDPDTREWWYDYDVDNSAGFKISVDRKTGKFKGSFNIYYDYVSAEDYVSGKQTQTHLVKNVVVEGVLTPVRPADGDSVAGGGFYLLNDKSSYLNPSEKEIFYSFTGSHDFQLMRPIWE